MASEVLGAYEGLLLKAACLPAARDCWPTPAGGASPLCGIWPGLNPALIAAASAPFAPVRALSGVVRPEGEGVGEV